MSTQPQYDPEKANAWTRDLPAKPPIKERPSFIDEANNPYAMSQQQRDTFDKLAKIMVHLQAVEQAASAVIAAGRPNCRCHEPEHTCPQCAAWDALAELLKTP